MRTRTRTAATGNLLQHRGGHTLGQRFNQRVRLLRGHAPDGAVHGGVVDGVVEVVAQARLARVTVQLQVDDDGLRDASLRIGHPEMHIQVRAGAAESCPSALLQRIGHQAGLAAGRHVVHTDD